MNREGILKHIPWMLLGILGASCLGVVALRRGEHISALWIIVASVAVYLVAYRYYSLYIATKVMKLDAFRATPAVVNNDGLNYVPTNKYVLFGHHFAAIAGAGPLVGPVLAAQVGYLPGTLWLLGGVVLAGAVQDFLVLFISSRRNGASLGEIIKKEMGPIPGTIALFGCFLIMIIILAVLALIVVKALAESPWGVFTVCSTVPIALFMGIYMRFLRPGRVGEISLIGIVLLVLSIWFGGVIAHDPFWGPALTFKDTTITYTLIGYAFISALLPVWLILAPRDYLATFLKIGVIVGLAIGIVILNPELKMPAMTQFIDGTGPVWKGSVFPFLFITIACGAVSGFHALIASGTTPKLLANEKDARFIGYGAMLMESFVAIMALVAASIIEPGLYFAMNTPPAALGITMPDLHRLGTEDAPMIMASLRDVTAHAAATVSSWGFVISPEQILQTAKDIGEPSVLNRAGGAPTLAVGIAHVFHQIIPGANMGFWYHFGILFEAMFILTALDAGTRSGRFMLQDLLGNFVPFLKKTDSLVAGIVGTAGCVGLWGYLLYQGVVDPLGGVKSLWPLFGISNQMLAAVALVLGTVVLIKMKRTKYIWVTVVPAVWLLICTTYALGLKLFSNNPQLEGFFFQAGEYKRKIAEGGAELSTQQVANMNHIVVNNYTNAGLSVLFLLVVYSIIFYGVKTAMAAHKNPNRSDQETPYVPVPEEAPSNGVLRGTSKFHRSTDGDLTDTLHNEIYYAGSFFGRRLCSVISARRVNISGRRRACWSACLTTIPTSSI
ncbi:Inner membrane protein YjiY [Serratia quinivorans]|nr:Inner membrane protein YjiY [Serratia quinivorans]